MIYWAIVNCVAQNCFFSVLFKTSGEIVTCYKSALTGTLENGPVSTVCTNIPCPKLSSTGNI